MIEVQKPPFYQRFAYMRSGTCRMLKLSTNADVSFLIYAVSGMYGRLVTTKLNLKDEQKTKIKRSDDKNKFR